MDIALNLLYSGEIRAKVDDYKICNYKKDIFDWILPIVVPSYIIKHRRTFCGIPLWWHKIYFYRVVSNTVSGTVTERTDFVFKIHNTAEGVKEEFRKLSIGYPPIHKEVYKDGELLYIQRKKRNWNEFFHW